MLAPPLRFELSVWRWTPERAAQQEWATTERAGKGGYLEVERFQLWELAARALQMRRRDRSAARRLLWRVREAWCERGAPFEFQRLLQDAQEIILFDELRPALERAGRGREQSRAAARLPRKGVRDDQIAMHRAMYVARFGTSRGWQKRAAIELGVTERHLRRRLEKMRT